MPSFTLTDAAHDLWVDQFAVSGSQLGFSSPSPWSVAKRTLRGGRRDGVDLIEVRNGALSFSIIPTRGMGLWKGEYRGDPIGWKSPVSDGPVHPGFVNQFGTNALGWLEGFDELLARCGLENNGAPYEVKTFHPDGSETNTVYPLHGKIANIPAHYVAVHIDDKPPHRITIEGHVLEAKLFHMQVRMIVKISTTPGSNSLQVRDEFVNVRDVPSEMQILYHWNFGSPHLEEGSRLAAPSREVCPRNAQAQAGLGHYDIYKGPEPGFAEQVYFFTMHGKGKDGDTLTMLRNHRGDKGAALRYKTSQLPCFTLWKNTGGAGEGYVTGLEPGTNYPNILPVEKARGRVKVLKPGESFVAETTLEVCGDADQVAKLEAEVKALQGMGAPVIHKAPVEPFVKV